MILEFEGDYSVLFGLLGRVGPFGAGTSVPVPAGGTLDVVKVVERRGTGVPIVAEIAISVASGVPVGLIANWLWEKLSDKAKHVIIDRTEISIETKDTFIRIVQEHLEIHD